MKFLAQKETFNANFWLPLMESIYSLSFESAVVKILKSKLIKESGSMDLEVSEANEVDGEIWHLFYNTEVILLGECIC